MRRVRKQVQKTHLTLRAANFKEPFAGQSEVGQIMLVKRNGIGSAERPVVLVMKMGETQFQTVVSLPRDRAAARLESSPAGA